MREKLIKLLTDAHSKATDEAVFKDATYEQQLWVEADFLIANGVTLEAEYCKAMEEIEKAKYETGYLRDELRNAKNALSWYEAMKQTIEVIFGRKFDNG